MSSFRYQLFDLEPRDIKVYEALFSQDNPSSIRAVASVTKLNRGTTFEIIKKLVNLGLVTSHYKNKRKYYAAQPPVELEKFASERAAQVTEQLSKVTQYAKSLERGRKGVKTSQFTQFYEGPDEINALLKDVLSTVSASPEKSYKVISSAEIQNRVYDSFRDFTKQRIKRGVFVNVIAVGEDRHLAELAERRWLSSSLSPACYVIIYGTKVAQISLSNEGNLQAAVVDNEGITHLQSLLFDHIWKTLSA